MAVWLLCVMVSCSRLACCSRPSRLKWFELRQSGYYSCCCCSPLPPPPPDCWASRTRTAPGPAGCRSTHRLQPSAGGSGDT
ncbi:MAG: hypothetical protein J3K34DRAFT_406985, partial [Monoraphidium minutum]